MLKSYLDLNLEVIKKADNSRYGNDIDIWLFNLAPIALFSKFKMTIDNNTGQRLQEISHAYIVYLKYKIISNARDSDDLSFGFDRSRGRRKDQLAFNKNKKVNIILELCSKMLLVSQNNKKKLLTD